ncbi:MAG: DUF456 domain-containing protein [Candidatus Dadabacteria bacterium]|nr:DUF456 domain-containing protein [Candidatus Dadabacteria bacterium]
MDYLVFIIFVFVAFGGLLSLIFGLPGNFIILADSILYGWYGEFKEITYKVILILIALTILGEVIEYVLGIVGAKKRGASKGAIIASIAGGIVGAIICAPFLFGIGSLIGAFLGAFAGAFLIEYYQGKGVNQAMESGWGALLGRVGGAITKGFIGVMMIIITVVSVVGE